MDQPDTPTIETMTTQNGDIESNRFPMTGKGAVLCGIDAQATPTETGATAQSSSVNGYGAMDHLMNPPQAPQHQAGLDQVNNESVESLPGTDAVTTDAGEVDPGADGSPNGSDEPTGSVKTQGTRRKGAGTGRAKGVRNFKSPKSKVATTGVGKSHAVTTKLDAELLRKLTMARVRSGMSESGLLRLALASYLDNLEQRSIAAEISKAAGAITAASQASTAPVVERLNTLEHRIYERLGAVVNAIKGIGNLLGEPVDLTGLDGLNDAGELNGGKS